jgi:hypothetical protein
MVETRRSSGVKQTNPLDSFKDRKRQKVLGTQAEGIQRLGRGTEECFRLVEQLLAHSTTGLWFRILPIDGHDDDICVGMGVEWHNLLPILIKCGLLRSRVTSVVKEVRIDATQWDQLAKSLNMRMEVTCIRTLYSRRSYFYCIGDPRFRGPLDQEKALQVLQTGKKTRGLPFLSRQKELPRQLGMTVTRVATAIVNDRLASRNQSQQQTQQQVDELNDDQVEIVANSAHEAIEYAVALDLDRRPRLSRLNAGTMIHVLGVVSLKCDFTISNSFCLF